MSGRMRPVARYRIFSGVEEGRGGADRSDLSVLDDSSENGTRSIWNFQREKNSFKIFE
jgi:hypothetical protein